MLMTAVGMLVVRIDMRIFIVVFSAGIAGQQNNPHTLAVPLLPVLPLYSRIGRLRYVSSQATQSKKTGYDFRFTTTYPVPRCSPFVVGH